MPCCLPRRRPPAGDDGRRDVALLRLRGGVRSVSAGVLGQFLFGACGAAISAALGALADDTPARMADRASLAPASVASTRNGVHLHGGDTSWSPHAELEPDPWRNEDCSGRNQTRTLLNDQGEELHAKL